MTSQMDNNPLNPLNLETADSTFALRSRILHYGQLGLVDDSKRLLEHIILSDDASGKVCWADWYQYILVLERLEKHEMIVDLIENLIYEEALPEYAVLLMELTLLRVHVKLNNEEVVKVLLQQVDGKAEISKDYGVIRDIPDGYIPPFMPNIVLAYVNRVAANVQKSIGNFESMRNLLDQGNRQDPIIVEAPKNSMLMEIKGLFHEENYTLCLENIGR